MKTLNTSLFLIFFGCSLSAQTHWLEASNLENGPPILVDHVSLKQMGSMDAAPLLNYNPTGALYQPTTIELSGRGLSQCNIFTVYRTKSNDREELIWQISNKQKDQLLLTDQRMADLSQGKFMNFLDHEPNQASINSYHHYRKSFKADELILAGNPNTENIPVSKFEGEIAELIIFDHKLAPLAQQVLESHLALKYSIPLYKGRDYLNGQGDAIWSYEKNVKFNANIAGLGRNDELHLNQKQSLSQLGNGFLAFGLGSIEKSNQANKDVLNEQGYILWGDDAGLIDFKEIHNQVHLLQRTWKLEASRFGDHELAFQLDHDGLHNSLEDDLSYFLLTSADDINNPTLASSEVYELTPSRGVYNGTVINIEGAKYFSLVKAPNLWMQIEVDSPPCESQNYKSLGSINVRPIGGDAPYVISLSDEYGNVIDRTLANDDAIINFHNLEADHYVLSIQDGKEHIWETEVMLNSSGLSDVSLSSKIILGNDESTFINPILDPALGEEYVWHLPDGSEITKAGLNIMAPGQYTFIITREHCQSLHKVNVIQETDNIVSSSLFPNPTTGHYTMSAELKYPTPYSIKIVNANGQILSEKNYSEARFISIHEVIEEEGIYFITLKSNASSTIKKLIVISAK